MHHPAHPQGVNLDAYFSQFMTDRAHRAQRNNLLMHQAKGGGIQHQAFQHALSTAPLQVHDDVNNREYWLRVCAGVVWEGS